jgi:hypothetical protein
MADQDIKITMLKERIARLKENNKKTEELSRLEDEYEKEYAKYKEYNKSLLGKLVSSFIKRKDF